MKKALITILSLMVMCVICGCNSEQKTLVDTFSIGVSDEQLKQDISNLKEVQEGVIVSKYIPNDTNYSVYDYQIMKRQTNLDNKEDIIFCQITVSNTYIRSTLNYKMVYNLYDVGGWIMDEYDLESHCSVPLMGIDENLPELFEEFSIVDRETRLSEMTDEIEYSFYDKYYEKHATVTFVFDQRKGWYIEEDETVEVWNDGTVYINPIPIVDLKKAFNGTFARVADRYDGSNSYDLKINNYDEKTNTVIISWEAYLYNREGQKSKIYYQQAFDVVGHISYDTYSGFPVITFTTLNVYKDYSNEIVHGNKEMVFTYDPYTDELVSNTTIGELPRVE